VNADRGGAGALPVAVEDLVLDGRIRIEDLVDREGLEELCRSFEVLFGISVRIYSTEGGLLADAATEHELCAYVNGTPSGAKACAAMVSAVKARDPGESGDVTHPCFTGATYRVLGLDYDGRRVGRLVVGPFLPASVVGPPASLTNIDPAITNDRAQALLARMPRAKAETVTRMAKHLRSALDLILFSGHKAHATSTMHLASVRESFRQLEEKTAKVQEAFDKLKELDLLKSAFLATVSHELRTPLTSIIGYSEMLVEGLAGEMKPEQAEFVQTIHEKGQQLLSLISGLLNLGKLESGTMRMAMRTVRIDEVLGEVASTLRPTARKKDVRIDVDAPDDLPDLYGDPERLRQVFLNLAENGVKFTPPGGSVTLRARLGHSVAGDSHDEEAGLTLLAPTRARVEVRVSDTGIGIPARERSKVFDAFYQVDSSSTRQYGGTGLGLSIAKRLLLAHAGTVCIEDNQPRGTVFVVSLPQHGPAAVAEAAPLS
jgi:two-component system sensor histidine kinase BarA